MNSAKKDRPYKCYFWEHIIEWYEENKRNFPWRQTDNPFHVLIAEFLLQQTHVRKVEAIYQNLIFNYPTPNELADADVEEIRDIIKPLGLLYRAERMKHSAQIIIKEYNGEVPTKLEELMRLPGVGEYIGQAVKSYGYNKKGIPIDTNVLRLFTRFFGLTSNNKRLRNDKQLKNNIKDYYLGDIKKCNLAVLDFAAKICTASNPKCESCPISDRCFELNQKRKEK